MKGSATSEALAAAIAEATAIEWTLLKRYGDDADVGAEIEKLSDAREKLGACARLNALLVGVCESQPQSDATVLELLEGAIARAEATLATSQTSLQEIRRSWHLSDTTP